MKPATRASCKAHSLCSENSTIHSSQECGQPWALHKCLHSTWNVLQFPRKNTRAPAKHPLTQPATTTVISVFHLDVTQLVVQAEQSVQKYC